MHRRRICPLTPMPRPVVLPGGRIWRKPKDAYNEEFIAETLINQAEVIVGSTLGYIFHFGCNLIIFEFKVKLQKTLKFKN